MSNFVPTPASREVYETLTKVKEMLMKKWNLKEITIKTYFSKQKAWEEKQKQNSQGFQFSNSQSISTFITLSDFLVKNGLHINDGSTFSKVIKESINFAQGQNISPRIVGKSQLGYPIKALPEQFWKAGHSKVYSIQP